MEEYWQFLEVLRKVEFFSGIADQDLLSMLGCLEARSQQYEKDSLIWHMGDQVSRIGVVLLGQVQIIKENILGDRTIVAVLDPGDVFGETFVCAGVPYSPVTVLTVTGCRVMYLSFPKAINSCGNACSFHSKLISNTLSMIARKNIALNTKIDFISRRTTREKLAAYLLFEYERQKTNPFSIGINRSELSDFLCVDRSAMSRELGRMRDEGVLDFYKNSFKILNFDGLGS